MRTVGRKIPRKRIGQSCSLCDTCGVRFYRGQLVRGRDGMLRCYGPGTNNDAKGRTALELDELVSMRSLEHAQSFKPSDDPGKYDGSSDI